MEFKRKNCFSSFKEKVHLPIICEDDITSMLSNEFLLEQRAHYIVTFENTYDDSKTFQHAFAPDRVKLLESSYLSGQTIVIKEVENWNHAIQRKCQTLEGTPNVHLYLCPSNGTSFGWHADDRDVYILMQKGEKLFEIEEPDLSVSRYVLTEGSELFIPYGAKHRAIASNKASIHLSFGIWPEGVNIRDSYASLPIPINLPL